MFGEIAASPERRQALTKTPLRQRPLPEQAGIVGFIALSLGVVAVAQNDLRHRPARQIRGRKIVWRLLSLNALGALIYLCFGRVPNPPEGCERDPEPTAPNERLMILDTPEVAHPEHRKLHTPDCRFAFRPGGRDRTYREATPEEIRTHARCSRC